MASTAIAVAAGVGSAMAYGIASTVQHVQAGRVPVRNPLDPGLIGALARRPIWLLGLVVDVAAVVLQTLALRYGPVVLVQLLIVGGLPVAVVLSGAWARVPLARADVVGLLLCTGGLVLAVPGTTTVSLGHPSSAVVWIVVAVVVSGAVGGLVLLGQRRPQAAPAATGVAAGISAGTSSVLLAICAVRIDHPVALLMTVAPYATVVVGLATLLLSQAAFQTGAIGTPLAALSVTEPAVAVVLAVTVLNERLPTSSVALAAAAAGVVAAAAGVITLSTSARLQLEAAA